MEADLGDRVRIAYGVTHQANGLEVGRERLLAQEWLARGEHRVDERAVCRRGRHDDDGIDIGIVDERLGIGRDAFERTDLTDLLDGVGGEVGRGNGTHLAVVGQ